MLVLALLLVWSLLAPPAYARDGTTSQEAPARVFINAKAAIVLDVDSGKTLYAKNADELLYPASTTKLMTAILLVTHLHPDDPVYVSADASRQPRVRLGVKPGTTLTADEALHALLMKSSNDVAYAIAQTVGGSQEGFARMMNLKARLIGCTRTNFVTPNGLHDDTHLSTAHDIALILAEAIKYPQIVAVLQTQSYEVAGKQIRNGNRFAYLKDPTFGEVIGGKTGYTSKAMYCLAFAVRQHGRVRVSVVLGAPRKSFMYRETRRLLEFAMDNRQVQLV
ncbi:D-alanyl-D-alanine carboxypeptidase [Alicyclobacillus cycloheptanicus]|nr:D-alanyl-D-alanine carboxypeptidase [Alicyclobacillus cycloheptanicus]